MSTNTGRGSAILLSAILAGAAADPSWADGSTPALGAMRESKPIVELRLRSERVDQSGMTEDAEALTLRGRLGFETGKAWSTSLLVDADLLVPIDSDYNSTTNGHTLRPVVADPETYEINRLQLGNTALPGTTIILGRQRMHLDDQRFIGSVGWRQNEQTFDALQVVNQSIPNLTLDVAYLNQVNRVFSKDSPVGRYHGDSYVVNASYQLPWGKLVGFGYLLDFDEAPADSSRTYGLRLTGERPVGRIRLSYATSYATQREHADSPLDYDLGHCLLELTGAYRGYSFGAGIEVLEGDGVKGFGAPLGTLHKFQGWADKFLATPPDGIDDRYVVLGYARKGPGFLETLAANASYHSFESERLAVEYGSEIDLQLQATWRRFNAVLKYADYRAERFATDTRKLWAQVDYVW